MFKGTYKEIMQKVSFNKPVLIKNNSEIEFEIIFLSEDEVIGKVFGIKEEYQDYSHMLVHQQPTIRTLVDWFEDEEITTELIVKPSSFSEKEQRLGPCTCKSFIGFGHEFECKWGKE